MQSENEVVDALNQWVHTLMRHSMRAFIQYIKENGLTMSHVAALSRVGRGGPCGINDIRDELGVTSAAASQMVDRLVLQGLVIRTEDPHDRRLKQIALTERGCEVLRNTVQARQAWLDDLVESLSNPEREQVATTFNLLVQKTDELEQLAEPEPEL